MSDPAKRRAGPTATWRWWEGIGVYLLAILASALVTAPIVSLVEPRGTGLLLANIAFGLVVIGTLVAWLSRFHPGWKEMVGFPARVGREIAAGAIFGSLLYPVIQWGVGPLLTKLLELFADRAVESPDQLPPNLGGGRLALAAIYVLAAAPAAEELFFRGVLFRALRDRLSPAVGILGSSLAFGAVHYVPSNTGFDSLLLMGAAFFIGVGFAWIYERRRNIVASVSAHAAFNLFGLALILWQRR